MVTNKTKSEIQLFHAVKLKNSHTTSYGVLQKCLFTISQRFINISSAMYHESIACEFSVVAEANSMIFRGICDN
ncbi:hypothetical protein T01_9012 [Trichinella spiralis]|uniref:Uncharacterized protein n=1 Tax=Trichinella spiralis TaxID=6334 RepID=A0A0V1AY28_TRISP|nr:hypothetical protein T01_2528 [Trichinella spiralis]KRY29687.1 hypothetical protein T01_9012 [Trichinella spiralis]